ncbi:hypothetical protein F5Y17DRAFT_452811 [Xylariaceae sp. FL0594]|nr:hypothetical protein F5Y17DRAFT_452811 [Xylariaceae sp. FL0594]
MKSIKEATHVPVVMRKYMHIGHIIAGRGAIAPICCQPAVVPLLVSTFSGLLNPSSLLTLLVLLLVAYL